MRPYKVTVGCTRFLSATAETEVINFQLYSQQDLAHLKLRVHRISDKSQNHSVHRISDKSQNPSVQNVFEIFEGYVDKPLEDQINKSDPVIPIDPPEVCSTSISLPYINFSIRISAKEIKKLNQIIQEVFPKTYYIEVQ